MPDCSIWLRRSTISALICVLLLGCASGTGIHQRRWIEVNTPNFRIMSTMSSAATSALAIELERFRAIIAKFTNAPLSDSPIPTKIFAFASKSDFQRFTRSSNIAGWMRPGMRDNVIAFADYRGMDSALTIRHEYVHFIMHNATPIQYPTWYNEGFAEYMSTFEIRDDRELVIGSAEPARVQVLNWAPWMPLSRVIAARDLSEFSDTEIAVFYAEAWAFVHYLQQGREGRYGAGEELDRYLQLVEAGASDEDAFEQAFGMDSSRANRELKVYLSRKIQAIVFALSVLDFDPPQPSVQPMSPDRVSTALGQLALTVGDGAEAEVYFEAAIATDPENARAHAGLGDALKFQQRWDEAEPHFERAVALDPDDALNHLDRAEYFHDKARDDAYADKRIGLLKAARREYVKSQKRDPSLPETYAMYGSTYLEPGQDHARAIQTLEHANRLLPSNTDILLMLAQAYAVNDREPEARALIERYVAWSHSSGREEAVSEIFSELGGESSAASER